jgi:hypothetical protein
MLGCSFEQPPQLAHLLAQRVLAQPVLVLREESTTLPVHGEHHGNMDRPLELSQPEATDRELERDTREDRDPAVRRHPLVHGSRLIRGVEARFQGLRHGRETPKIRRLREVDATRPRVEQLFQNAGSFHAHKLTPKSALANDLEFDRSSGSSSRPRSVVSRGARAVLCGDPR